MSEYSARNLLKNWAKRIMNELNMKNEIEYLVNKVFIIRVFSTVLIYKSKYDDIDENIFTKDNLEKDFVWNKVGFIYSRNNFNNVIIDEIDDMFFNEITEFSISFCNENYQYLDNILAWLYQYLNINRVDNVNKDTQFFTDQYMVEYLVNESLDKFKNYNINEIKIIDVACGGGNFLVSVLEKIYLMNKLDKDKFLDFISKNLFGYDVDKNLSIISVINIYVKMLELDILEINELFDYDINVYYDTNNKLGSLLKIEDSKDATIINAKTGNKHKYEDIFGIKYDLLITNPPFKGSREQDKDIRDYINENYKHSKGDICYAFIERLYDLVKLDGVASFVTQNGWMYLESYTDLRKNLLTKGSLDSIVDLGSNSFYDLSGEKTNISLIIYLNNKKGKSVNICGLKEYSYAEKVNKLKSNNKLIKLKYEDILKDSFYRIDYISDGKIKQALKQLPLYKEFGVPMQGTSTGDTKTLVSYHWEHDDDDWKLVSKGGGYCKWTGLNIYKVNWGRDGEVIRQRPNSVLRNIQYFDSTELVYSDTGTSGLSVRLLRDDQIFIASGPGIRIIKGYKYCHLAFLNSRVASYYIRILTPKLTISATYISQIPVADDIMDNEELSNLTQEVVMLKNQYNKKRSINYEYECDNYLQYGSIYLYAKEDFINDLEIELNRIALEAEINNLIISKYDFNDSELEIISSVVGISPYFIDDKEIDLNHKELDELISKILDNNCYVKSKNKEKKSLGSEGILEYIAINHRINPEKLVDYIRSNIEDYQQTIMKYYKHTLHRLKLLEINYLNQGNYKYREDSVKYIVIDDLKKYNIKIDIEKWFESELYKWHYDSFFKRPIMTNGEN